MIKNLHELHITLLLGHLAHFDKSLCSANHGRPFGNLMDDCGNRRGNHFWEFAPSIPEGLDDVSMVAGKALISAITIERDGYLFASELGKNMGRKCRRICIWLIVVPYQLWQDLDGIRLYHKFPIIGVVALCNHPRARTFIKRTFLKTDRESLDWFLRMLGHKGHH